MLCFAYPTLQVSLGCPFLTIPSVFSNIYWYELQTMHCINTFMYIIHLSNFFMGEKMVLLLASINIFTFLQLQYMNSFAVCLCFCLFLKLKMETQFVWLFSNLHRCKLHLFPSMWRSTIHVWWKKVANYEEILTIFTSGFQDTTNDNPREIRMYMFAFLSE